MDGKYGGERRLTLQQGCCCGYRLRDSIHAVDGLEELWDTIVLIRYQHLNLISASVMAKYQQRGEEGKGRREKNGKIKVEKG